MFVSAAIILKCNFRNSVFVELLDATSIYFTCGYCLDSTTTIHSVPGSHRQLCRDLIGTSYLVMPHMSGDDAHSDWLGELRLPFILATTPPAKISKMVSANKTIWHFICSSTLDLVITLISTNFWTLAIYRRANMHGHQSLQRRKALNHLLQQHSSVTTVNNQFVSFATNIPDDSSL